LLLPFTLLLVCEACLVSVSVRPERYAYRDLQGTRDTTPVSCRFVCCLPPRHAALASMALPVGSRFIDLSRWPRARRGASSARSYSEPAGSGHKDGPRCTVRVDDGSGSPSRGVVTCASHRKVLVGWGIARIVTTGWRLCSDDAVGAERLPQLRGQDCSSNRMGWCRYDPLAWSCHVHVSRSCDWRRTLLI